MKKTSILISFGIILILIALGIFVISNDKSISTPKEYQIEQIVENQQGIIKIINNERSNAGLPKLKEDVMLDYSASLKAEDMNNRRYFSHESPEGFDGYEILLQQYAYKFVGENLGRNYYNDQELVNAWLKSREHRKLLMMKEFTFVGFSRAGKYSVLHLAD